MNCGNCLMEKVEMVTLKDGVCPKCGTDYRDVPRVVDVYQDPYTRLKKEGTARLIKKLDATPETVEGGRMEYWDVAFIGGRGRLERPSYPRWVLIADK